jgi:hypothetical protein
MAQKQKPQPKPKPPKEKIRRFVPNINLLKNMNAVFLVAGFGLSLMTVFLLSSHNNTYDVRSRANPPAEPTLTPLPTLCQGVCPTPSPEIEHP